jgi:hypothetical protein
MGVRQLSRPPGVTRLYAWVDGFCLRTHAIIIVGRSYGDDLQAPLTALGTLLYIRAREPLYEGGGRLQGRKEPRSHFALPACGTGNEGHFAIETSREIRVSLSPDCKTDRL